MTNGCHGRGCHKLIKDASESVTCVDLGGGKLDTFNWLENIPETFPYSDVVEVRFKNTRKGFFRNVNDLKLK
jgi:hypothetical protein